MSASQPPLRSADRREPPLAADSSAPEAGAPPAPAATGVSPAPALPAEDGAPLPALPPAPPPAPAAGARDRALVARLLAGDEDAFLALVEELHGRLLRFVQALLADPESAADVVQDTWLAVVANLSQWEGRAALRTWIYSIATNRARKALSRRGREIPLSALVEDAGPRTDETPRTVWPPAPAVRPPEARLHEREVAAVLERAIAGLPPGQRAVLVLCDLEGLDSDSVCNVLGLSRTNRRVLLHRARVRVREILKARFERL